MNGKFIQGLANTKRIIWEYNEKIYDHKFNNSDKLNYFPPKYEIGNLNSSITIKALKRITLKSLKKGISRPRGFH